MRSFMYTIKIPLGMHARHAGMLVKAASPYQSRVTISFGDRSADGKRILALMGLGIKQGDLIRVDVDGPDEDEAAIRLKAYIWENF
ncbi:MAG: HPr family phosphocarrier protein [Clostridia bacterium]|nr:HPr family phosphocarrier protein [Clostridia bacterium]